MRRAARLRRENATWRNFFLKGAKELREGVGGTADATAPPDIVANLSGDNCSMRWRPLDGPRAWDIELRIDWVISDPDEAHAITVRNASCAGASGRTSPLRTPLSWSIASAKPAAAQNRRHRRARRERAPPVEGDEEDRRAARPARRAGPGLAIVTGLSLSRKLRRSIASST